MSNVDYSNVMSVDVSEPRLYSLYLKATTKGLAEGWLQLNIEICDPNSLMWEVGYNITKFYKPY